MTPEAQRIAIAEACGWKNCFHDSAGTFRGSRKESKHNHFCDLSDLNAMHEAEKVLTYEQSVTFRIFLSRNSDGRKASFHTVEAAMCHATAAQRAEAFLRTLNLWDDSK